MGCRWGVRNFIHISSPSLYFDYHHIAILKKIFALTALPTSLPAESSQRRSDQYAFAGESTNALTILRPQSLFGPHDKVFIPRLRI